MEKRYWKGVEELNHDPEFIRLRNDEFYEHLPIDEVVQKKSESDTSTSRRDFLKFMGFSVAAASLAACEAPVRKAVPYLVKPEEVTLGVPNYYASSYFDGNDYCSVLVKTREGRPIKIEGNELSSITRGGTNARVQASVLSLYDSNRLQHPLKGGKKASWKDIDTDISAQLSAQSAAGKKIVVLASSQPSPSAMKALADFTLKYPGSRVVHYDATSYNGLFKAAEACFGSKTNLPLFRFDKSDVIVSFGADFLGTWLSPIEFSRQYAETRRLRKGKTSMSRHIQYEALMSLSGSNADERHKIRRSEQGQLIAALYNKIAQKAGVAGVSASAGKLEAQIAKTADELWNARGRSLVVSGGNNPDEQILVFGINQLLGNYGTTLRFDRICNLRWSDDTGVATLLDEMNRGEVGALICWNTNPVYTLPEGEAFAKMLAKVPLKVSLSTHNDETASVCDYACPDHHYLESWNDWEVYKGQVSLSQPVIRPLFDTRQAAENFLKWSAAPVSDYYTHIRNHWTNTIYTWQSGITSFEAFWNNCVRDGVFEIPEAPQNPVFAANVQEAAARLPKAGSGVEVVLYEKIGIGNGLNTSNNPWLHELPDPISKVCWDNYFAVLPAYATKMGWKQGTVIQVKAGNATVKGPVYLQPGMSDETIGVAIGYGRTKTGKAGNNIGFNAYPLSSFENGFIRYYSSGVTVSKTTDDDYVLAATQTHHTMMGREIVKETTLGEWKKDPKAGNPDVLITTPTGKKKPEEVDLWQTEKNPEHPKPNHFWGLAIDLNACIGCGSCVVACNAENNVPVVGKDEVLRSREMHWIRIDRYYSSDTTKENAGEKNLGKLDMYGEMEKPAADNPEVVYQPVMCQHCNHAPCETVCPVAATTHGSDGLNMMAYNRCVGTRYCANNCPYKVRRFNWFKYSDNEQFPYNMDDTIGKMVLNPDVTVRSRGVMEKCSMCVQRIQYGKLEAKKAGKRPADGEIKTACAQACPTHAIVFGDYNLENSELNELWKDKRSYHLLAELNVQPSVFYQTKVRNTKKEGQKA